MKIFGGAGPFACPLRRMEAQCRAMKYVAVFMIGAALLVAPASSWAQVSLSKLKQIPLYGHDYVRLEDWTRANGLAVHWIKRDHQLSVTRRSWRLEFTADSALVSVNGVNVWLSYPVVVRSGIPYVTYIDLKNAVEPLMYPPRNVNGDKIKVVALDPGHGGKDTGNRVGNRSEKTYTLLLANEVREQLKKHGIKAVLTRTSDRYVELDDRPALARKAGADLFVSLHFNATSYGRDQAEGSEVFCVTPMGASSTNARGAGSDAQASVGNRYNDKNLLLAYEMQRALTTGLKTEDRGVRRARFAVLRGAAMPAVLVEAGFMSHPSEGKRIFSPGYRQEIAKAVVSGILAYKAEVE